MCRKLIVGVFLLFGAIEAASATEVFYEEFNYTVGQGLSTQVHADSGNSWLPPNAPNGSPQNIVSGDVNYPGLAGDTNGASLSLLRAQGTGEHSENRINIPGRPYTRASGASVYFSFTMKMTAWTYFAPPTGNPSDTKNDAAAKNTTHRRGGFLAGFHGGPASTATNMQSAGGFAAPIYVRREIDFTQPGTDGTDGTQTEKFELGIAKSASIDLNLPVTESELVYDTSHSFGIGDVVLVVGQYDFVGATGGGSSDIARLWINPTPGDLAAEATPSWVAPASAYYPDMAGSLSIETFHTRRDSVSPGNFVIDNIRVGTTFGDVIPVASETGVDGDFNDDGVIDAADYVTWRKNAPGTYTESDYQDFVTNFGTTIGGGGGSGSVPEPGMGCMLLVLGLAGLAQRRRGCC